MMTTACVAARNHHHLDHSTRAKKGKKVSSKVVPLVVVARGFAASAFAEAETTRESQLRLGAAKYAIGENNTASLTQGRICLHRNDHHHDHHPRFPRRMRWCCSSFPLSLVKCHSIKRARKCKEIAHVTCTEPPPLKKTLEVSVLRKELKKKKKEKKKREDQAERN